MPATGTIEYQYMLVKANFPEDVWVNAAEMRPGNSKVVHHGEVWVLPPGSKWMAEAAPGVSYPQSQMPKAGRMTSIFLASSIPASARRISSSAIRPSLSRRDRTSSSRSTTRRWARRDRPDEGGDCVREGTARHALFHVIRADGEQLVIPAGDSNAEVVSEITMTTNTKLVMCSRTCICAGKITNCGRFPDGESQMVFRAKWDFNWQLGYICTEPIDCRRARVSWASRISTILPITSSIRIRPRRSAGGCRTGMR